MEGLPDIVIPNILSFLGIRDIHKCACIGKEWAPCAHRRLVRMEVDAAQIRDQVYPQEFRLHKIVPWLVVKIIAFKVSGMSMIPSNSINQHFINSQEQT